MVLEIISTPQRFTINSEEEEVSKAVNCAERWEAGKLHACIRDVYQYTFSGATHNLPMIASCMPVLMNTW